jgi:hypothetical protein
MKAHPDEIGIFAARGIGDQHGDFDQMVDVGLLGGSFSPLMHMPPPSSVSGLEHLEPFLHLVFLRDPSFQAGRAGIRAPHRNL